MEPAEITSREITQPEITVLLSTHDGAAFLDAQLDSLVAQTERRWRLVVVDDGSTDETPQILDRWAARDERIVCTAAAGAACLGPAARYLSLLADVTTPWWAFCDQDDVWTADHLAVLLAVARQAEVSAEVPLAVFSDATVVDEALHLVYGSAVTERGFRGAGRPQLVVPLAPLLLHNVAIGMTMLGNRSLARRATTGVDPGDPRIAMHDWWVASVAAATGRLSYLARPTVAYRQHAANVTGVPATTRERLRLAGRHGLPARTDRIVRRAARQAAALVDLLDTVAPDEAERLAALADTRITVGALRRLQRQGVRLPGTAQQLALLAGAATKTRAGSAVIRPNPTHHL